MSSYTEKPFSRREFPVHDLSYFVYINKNLIKVNSFPVDWKERYPGSKIVVLNQGKVKIITRKTTAECSMIYYKNKNYFRGETFCTMLDGESLFTELKNVGAKAANYVTKMSDVSDVVLRLVTRAENILDTTAMAFEWSSFVIDILLFTDSMLSLNDLIARIKASQTLGLRNVLSLFSILTNILKVMSHFAAQIQSIETDIVSSFFTALNTVRRKITSMRGESGETLENCVFVTLLETFLPKPLKGILSKMPLYTRDKILDDSSLVQDSIAWIMDLPVKLGRALGLPDKYIDVMINALMCVPCSSSYIMKKMIKHDLDQVTEKKSIVYNPLFQEEFSKHYGIFQKWKNENLSSFDRLPLGTKNLFERAHKIFKKVEYMRNVRRIEPVFVVFYGPPGTGKTTLMGNFLDRMRHNHSIYPHNSYDPNKDFYDGYDGEYIVSYDDIGQFGVFQWAGMITMISAAQCSLNCAGVEYKDLKRFTSRLVIATTNNINLRITPVDGITDVEALYRRIQLFDFSRVTFVDGVFHGHIDIKRRVMGQQAKWNLIRSIDVSQHPVESIYEFIQEEINKRKEHYDSRTIENGNPLPFLGEGITAPSSEYDSEEEFVPYVMRRNSAPEVVTPFNHPYTYPRYSPCDFSDDSYTDGVFSEASSEIGDLFDNCSSGMKTDWIWYLIFVCVIVFGILLAVWWFYSSKRVIPNVKHKKFYKSDVVDKNRNFRGEVDIADLFREKPTSVSPQVDILAKNTVVVKLIQGQEMTISTALFSGKYFSTIRHGVLEPKIGSAIYAKVYNTSSHILYDMIKVTLVYYSDKDDLAIFELPRELPVYFKTIPNVKESNSVDIYLCTPQSHVELPHLRMSHHNVQYICEGGFVGSLLKNDFIYEAVRGSGLCGSPCVTKDGLVLGHHVAGSTMTSEGASKIFSKSAFEAFVHYMIDMRVNVLNVSEKKFGSAGAVLESDVKIYNSKHTTITPSDVHGIFPLLRQPANLSVNGKNSVLDRAEPAMTDTPIVRMNCLQWAREQMENLVCATNGSFSAVSDHVALNGYASMGKIELSTSAGYGFPGKKREWFYVDENFDLHMKPQLKEKVDELERQFIEGSYGFDTWHKDCLKDELRNLEKVDNPRVFAAAPLDIMVLERKYFSQLLHDTHTCDKLATGVQVGINPFSNDWEKLAQFVTKFGNNVFDGDVASWDKKMNPAFQRELNEIIVNKFKGSNKEKLVVKFLLELLVSCPHVNTDIAYITTHSLPSGRLLTADYNSLMNKFYNLYVFACLYFLKFGKLPSSSDYFQNVAFVAYGDDSLTGVSKRIIEWYNAISVQKIFREMGMDFTPADKGEWTYKSRSIYDCSFLKRTFALHKVLGVVAPLDPLSMCSTLNYVKDVFRSGELTEIKLLNFQREAFLHVSYKSYMKHVKTYLEDKNIQVQFLSEKALIDLYNKDEYIDLLELH